MLIDKSHKGKTGVYKIVNVKSPGYYIGSAARCFYKRWLEHIRFLKSGEHENKRLQLAWNKYGTKAFRFEVLELCISSNCLVREQVWLDSCKGDSLLYNHCLIAGSVKGLKHSEEAKAKMSKARKGKPLHPRTFAAMMKVKVGWVPSEKTRAIWRKQRKGKGPPRWAIEKARQNNLGRKDSLATRRLKSKLSKVREAAFKANGTPKHTTKSKQLIAEASRRMWTKRGFKEEVGKKISKALVGKSLSPQHINRLIESHNTPAFCKRMRAVSIEREKRKAKATSAGKAVCST